MKSRFLSVAIPFLILAGFFASDALAFGHLGHQAIAQLAESQLDLRARAAVKKLLGTESLAQASTWADELKEAKKHHGPIRDREDALRINRDFPENAVWHYLDLPLGTQNYRDAQAWERPDGLVEKIHECIDTLEDPSSRKLDKKSALRFLVHLVGDLHQPLHVGSGFYDLSSPKPRLILDPKGALGRPNDEGGNLLVFGKSSSSNLHHLWDTELVEKTARTRDPEVLARSLEKLKSAIPLTPGDYHLWAEKWAMDSLLKARIAYRDIRFVSAEMGTRGRIKKIAIQLPANYRGNHLEATKMALAQAGFRLAQLLNSLQWK